MDNEQGRNGPDNAKTILALFYFICRALAAMMEMFLHKSRTFGERHLGLQAAAAIPIMFFFTAFWRGEDVRPVFGFLMAYIVACAAVRIGVLARMRAGGTTVHTYYTGTPRVMRLTGSLNEETVKRVVEPMMVFTIGALTLPLSLPLGTLIMLGGFGLFASVNLTAEFDRTRALDMNDALIDQANLAQRLRGMRGQ